MHSNTHESGEHLVKLTPQTANGNSVPMCSNSEFIPLTKIFYLNGSFETYNTRNYIQVSLLILAILLAKVANSKFNLSHTSVYSDCGC